MSTNPPIPDKLLRNARCLRREMTIPERLLWGKLRDGRLAGLKFRRQHPIDPYVADFYCHDHRLVIELDGESRIDAAEYDRQRESLLRERGVRVVRFHNDDIIRDLDAVFEAILRACTCASG